MNKEEAIEIPFGAKDSELCGFEYTIPEGMEAEIKDGKVIIRQKESEDERIRKKMIQWFNEYKEGNPLTICDEEIDSWIAYLEKQKEQNPKDSEEIFESIDRSFRRGREVGFREGVESVKQSAELSEEDEIKLASLINYFEGDALECSTEDMIRWLKLLPERFNLSPKQEWSEEDKDTLGDAITAVDMMLTDSFQGSHPNLFKAFLIAKDFLKSLPERFNLQPKQELSEEDEKDIILAIRQVWQEKDANRLIAKLKSLCN